MFVKLIYRCLKITTVPTKAGNRASVKAVLETLGDDKFDWELFDTLYVSMVVADNNQVLNNKRTGIAKIAYSFARYKLFYVPATLTIGVININDNPPVFVTDTLEDKSIRENSPVDQLIGYVVATDPDNLDVITYAIE